LNDDPLQVYFSVGQKLNVTGTNIYDVIDEQQLTTLVVMDNDCIGSYKTNHHMIMTMTAPY
jgi:hypothetical protein